jgi:predicted metal-dependent hydrolase
MPHHRLPVTRTLVCAGATITYELQLARRKTLAIRVHPDAHVSVSAPLGSNLTEIEEFIIRRAAWILRHQRNFAQKAAAAAQPRWVSGAIQRFLGKEYRLDVLALARGREAVRIAGDCLEVSTRTPADPTRVEALVEAWLRQEALTVFAERVAVWYPHLALVGTPPPQVAVRSMRSRWGSCTINGKITLTTRLVTAPLALIDYVAVHELCHLKERNHGPRFYQLLVQLMPDWKERKNQLKTL